MQGIYLSGCTKELYPHLVGGSDSKWKVDRLLKTYSSSLTPSISRYNAEKHFFSPSGETKTFRSYWGEPVEIHSPWVFNFLPFIPEADRELFRKKKVRKALNSTRRLLSERIARGIKATQDNFAMEFGQLCWEFFERKIGFQNVDLILYPGSSSGWNDLWTKSIQVPSIEIQKRSDWDKGIKETVHILYAIQMRLLKEQPKIWSTRLINPLERAHLDHHLDLPTLDSFILKRGENRHQKKKKPYWSWCLDEIGYLRAMLELFTRREGVDIKTLRYDRFRCLLRLFDYPSEELIEGERILIIDDNVAYGGTMVHLANFCRQCNCRSVMGFTPLLLDPGRDETPLKEIDPYLRVRSSQEKGPTGEVKPLTEKVEDSRVARSIPEPSPC